MAQIMKEISKWIMIFFCCLFCIGCSSQEKVETENTTRAIENTFIETDNKDKSDIEEKNSEEISEEISEKTEAYINAYINLSDDIEVEGYEWMQYDDEQVLRVKIQYKELPINNYKHKEDYFLFITPDEDVSMILVVNYEDKGIHIRLDEEVECTGNHYLGEGCSFTAHFEDITFDGNKDLIISVGNSRHAEYYCAYIYENDEFRYEKTFEHIPSYEISNDEKAIHGSDTDGMGLFIDTTYEYRNGEFVLIEKKEHMNSD